MAPELIEDALRSVEVVRVAEQGRQPASPDLERAPLKPGNLEVHCPEGNALLSASAIDPDSMEPDFNAVVTLEAI